MDFAKPVRIEKLRGDLGEVEVEGVPLPRYRSPSPARRVAGVQGLPVLAFGCAPVPPAPLT